MTRPKYLNVRMVREATDFEEADPWQGSGDIDSKESIIPQPGIHEDANFVDSPFWEGQH